jgi:hypothetical protein
MTREAWRRIRGLRSEPPLLAAAQDRRLVFSSALEQSEELFEAARVAGAPSKPLPLFYALSQAGRAIAAAHDDTAGWKSYGHGLTARHADDIRRSKIRIKPDKADTLSSVTRALDSGPLAGTITVGELWAALPELSRLPRMRAGATPVAQVRPEGDNPLHLKVLHPARGSVVVPVSEEEDVTSALGRYYDTEGCQVTAPLPPLRGMRSVTVEWPTDPPPDSTPGTRAYRAMYEVTEKHEGEWFLIPRLGDSGARPSRLLIWWALLYGLSSLARYQPAEWVGALNIDQSPFAVDLEEGLRIAEEAVPPLIADALGRRGDPPRPFMNEELEKWQQRGEGSTPGEARG